MDCLELSPKRRKIEPTASRDSIFLNDCAVSQNLNGGVCVKPANSTTNYRDMSINGIILSSFLERLKLRTIPLISPLLERLSEAENKNIAALKSIDKINKRIKELEFHVEKKVKTVPTSSVAIGTDLTDHHSDEHKRIMNGLQSSPFAPFKPLTSQACRMGDMSAKDIDPRLTGHNKMSPSLLQQSQSTRGAGTQPRGSNGAIDLTNEEMMMSSANKLNGTNHSVSIVNALQSAKSKTHLSQKLDIISAQFLPLAPITDMLSGPRLTWSLVRDGICLQWDVQKIDPSITPTRYEISSFQRSEISHNNFPWRKIGEVAALPLPMACTLTYVAKMNTYFFAIRAWVHDDTASVWSNVIMVEIN